MERRRFLLGVLIVAGVAVSWVGSTQFSQSTQNDYGDSIDSPLFMTWSSTLLNLALAAPAAARRCAPRAAPRAPGAAAWCAVPGFTAAALAPRVLFFYATWLVANYSYLRALRGVSASLVTALFSTAPAFVAVGSAVVLRRRLPPLGWAAVALTVAGAVLVAEPWHGGGGAVTRGVLLSLLAAAEAAVYKVSFKAVFGEPSPETVGVFLAWLGVCSATIGTAILFSVLGAGAEHVRWQDIPWGTLTAAHSLSLLFNFLVNFGIAFTYPLFISLGTVVGIPLNIAADAMWRNKTPTATQGGGIACIAVGFVLLLYCDFAEGRGRSDSAADGLLNPVSPEGQLSCDTDQ